ncbi:MAG TPA: OB-fold domain-containing protein [Thermoplasmata archaeon]|nr:OB-fold domain-containing protein [Thermoplasmata archaeon]
MADVPAPVHSVDAFRREYEEGHRLYGFRSECGFATVTWGLVCPRCGRRDLADAELSSAGRLVAFSVQTVPSDEFLNEAPYAYVLVDLDGGARVSGWVAGVARESDLAVGERLQLVASYKSGVQFRREPRPGGTT